MVGSLMVRSGKTGTDYVLKMDRSDCVLKDGSVGQWPGVPLSLVKSDPRTLSLRVSSRVPGGYTEAMLGLDTDLRAPGHPDPLASRNRSGPMGPDFTVTELTP
jgi:hypothetical protein